MKIKSVKTERAMNLFWLKAKRKADKKYEIWYKDCQRKFLEEESIRPVRRTR